MFRNNFYISNNVDVEIPAHLNFGKYMLDRIKAQPKENIALINGTKGTKVTYGEFTQFAIDLAMCLTRLGVGRGDVVAMCSEYRNKYIPIILGVILTGATYTPLSFSNTTAKLKGQLALSKPKYLIVSKKYWDTYKDVLENFNFDKYITLDEIDFDQALPIQELTTKQCSVEHFLPANVKGQEDVVHIMYSSGTTASPKAIMTTHLSCITNSLTNGLDDPSMKISISEGTWCHSYNNHRTFRFLAGGKTVVYYSGGVSNFLKCVDTYKPTVAFLRPLVVYEFLDVKDLHEYNMESLQYVYCGTSVLQDDMKDKFIKRLPHLKKFVKVYGTTETFELASQDWGEPGHKPTSVGKPGLRTTLKIIDILTQKPLGPNQRGEICVDAHNKFKGYIGLDPATYLDEEGFLKSGDLGYYDEDGYIYYVDRIKQLISYDGFLMPPVEMESILLKYPGVKDAGVVGVPDPKVGEYPIAFIVKEPGSGITDKEIIDYFDSVVPLHMRLRGGIKFIDEIPRNCIGKIIRSELKKMSKNL